MKILLISVNRERMPFPVFPLGLAYIAMALRKEGHQVEVMDLCFSQEISIDLNQTLHQFQPDLIGISLRNLDNLTYPNPRLLSPRGGRSCWRDLSSIPFIAIGHRRLRIFFSPSRTSPVPKCRLWDSRGRGRNLPAIGEEP